MTTVRFAYGLKPILKHGDHNQKTHGNWATGSEGKTLTGLIDKLSEKKTPGFSIDIRTKKSPKSGYMCSIAGAEKQIKLDEWNALGRDGQRSAIEQYKADNMEALSKRGAYFGAWKSPEDGVVYLDVSRRYESKSEGVSAGYKNSQKSIYDVANDRYIYMEEENGGREANKARAGGIGKAVERDDRGGIERVDARDSSGDRGQFLEPHVCLGRAITVIKHQEGQHDQSTHGNWAAGKYPSDSVKAARDGALDYAYKKGLDYNKDIDYSKVVANRERASNIADIYEELPKMDRDAVDEYEALASEVEEQFDFMTKNLGIKVEFVSKDPYKNSKDMFADVSTGKLKVLQTASTGAHPLFSDAQNDKFRAVHDFFGHAATGRGFGQDGEEAAWVHHSQMFTEKARAALTTETRGQNSFFNNRGKQFADQKVALLPEEYWQVPATFSKSITIRFEYGLKPVFKHGEHDQSTHGNWATGQSTSTGGSSASDWEKRGYPTSQAERIAGMSGKGPTTEDLDNLLKGGAGEIDPERVRFMIDNDAVLNADVEDRIEQMLNDRDPDGEYSEEQRLALYDDLREEAIRDMIDTEAYSLEQYARDNDYDSLRVGVSTDEMISPFNEVFGMTHEGVLRSGSQAGKSVTLRSQVTAIEIDSDGIHVFSRVFDENGVEATYRPIERIFSKDPATGTWSVEHEWMEFNEGYKGTGFGGKFIQQSEDWYISKGLTHINTLAGLEDGARHWAKAGFDWNRDDLGSSISKMRAAIDQQEYNLDRVEEKFGKEVADNWRTNIAEARTLLGRMSDGNGNLKDMRDDDFPKPYDFAKLGFDNPVTIKYPNGTSRTSYYGKELLANKAFYYTKALTAEGRNLLDGPIDMDGDGLVYDGTPREKPAPSGNN